MNQRTITGFILFCLVITGLIPASVPADTPDAVGRPVKAQGPSGIITLLPVPLPDLSRTEPEVRTRLQAIRGELVQLFDSDRKSSAKLARAYGELGQIYHSHHIYIPAAPCYANAETLAPETFKWPYYRGYLAQQTSQLDKARNAFERAMTLRPDYAPGKLRLAEVYLEQNKPDLAEPLLNAITDAPGLRGAVLFAQGRLALARRDYATAIKALEGALREHPQASSIRYPLAMAWRAMKQIDKAKENLALHGGGKPNIQDPVIAELEALLGGSRTYLHRAMAAVKTREFDVAAAAFGEALKQEPGNVNIRISLARSLYLSGHPAASEQQLREVLDRAPEHAMGNFLMGLMRDSQGKQDEARKRYETTLRTNPRHGGAHHYLANLLMAARDYHSAAGHFTRAVEIVPANHNARFMAILAGLRGNISQVLLRQQLESAHADYPQQPRFTYLLARLLAASPDKGVRDGHKALELAQALSGRFETPENMATLAMALAEQGKFKKATLQQQMALARAIQFQRIDLFPWLQAQLERFEQQQSSEQPFAKDDPMFRPLPVDLKGPFQDYPAKSPY